jgi:phosphatidylglycerophosphate synthase
MNEQIDDRGYSKKQGKPAEIIANRINADYITICGGILGIAGSFLLGSPKDATQIIEKLSRGHMKLSKKTARTVGAVTLATSYFFDLIDGEVARKSSGGGTKHGIILDGIVDKIVDISPAIFASRGAKTFDERLTWSLYRYLAPVSTMIRSVGLQHDIPIAKTGWGARVGRIPMLVSAMLFENRRSLFGKILVGQLIADSINRYGQIINSGNKEAQTQVQQDLAEYNRLFWLSTTLSPNCAAKELTTTGLGLLKLTQVKIREAYKH